MGARNRRTPGTRGSVRRGQGRTIGGISTDALAAIGGGGGGADHGITQLTGDVTAGPGDGSQAAAIGASKVTTTTIADAAVTTVKIADANVTLAKLANLATQRLLGRNTAGTGVPEAVTLSQLLDWIGSAAQGDLLFRGASGWQRLAAGTAGQFLQTAGSSANPVWGAVTGGASPAAAAKHIEYMVDVAGTLRNNLGQAGTLTATTKAWPTAGNIGSEPFFQVGTSAAANSSGSGTSQSSSPGQELAFVYDFDLSFVIKTDAAALTNVRYMIGMGVNNEDADTVTANWIGFRYSTNAGDGGWVGITRDGTQAVTGTIAAIAAATRYVLRIRKVGGTVFFSVNGGAETSTSTNVPTNNAYAAIVFRVTALAASSRSIWINRIYCDIGT